MAHAYATIPTAYFGATSNVTFADNAPAKDTITRAAGSWITDGFRPGMPIRVWGSTSNNGVHAIFSTAASVTAFVLTLSTASSLIAEGPVGGVYVEGDPWTGTDDEEVEAGQPITTAAAKRIHNDSNLCVANNACKTLLNWTKRANNTLVVPTATAYTVFPFRSYMTRPGDSQVGMFYLRAVALVGATPVHAQTYLRISINGTTTDIQINSAAVTLRTSSVVNGVGTGADYAGLVQFYNNSGVDVTFMLTRLLLYELPLVTAF